MKEVEPDEGSDGNDLDNIMEGEEMMPIEDGNKEA
tara:strand:- start:19841 stop:19945 length:105 start_codon:yes stop_codon:yes gene_type:complete